MNVAIHADASPAIGTGHVMRCLALALWAQQGGMSVTMTGHVQVPWLHDRLIRERINFCFLEHGTGPETIHSLPSDSSDTWIILDGYHFDLDCQLRARHTGAKLLIIDDYAHQPDYSCDILLNPNIGASGLPYNASIGLTLLEPRYALLHPGFVDMRRHGPTKSISTPPRNILISLGGGDNSMYWQAVLAHLSALDLRGTVLRVVAGATPESTIKAALQHVPAKLEILSQVDDMPALFQWADFCLTAAGSTCWELCCLGVPFTAFSIADNQQRIAEYLHKAGISLSLRCGWPATEALRHARKRGMALVDGLGAKRVLKALRESKR